MDEYNQTENIKDVLSENLSPNTDVKMSHQKELKTKKFVGFASRIISSFISHIGWNRRPDDGLVLYGVHSESDTKMKSIHKKVRK